jgi:hypothetical protein
MGQILQALKCAIYSVTVSCFILQLVHIGILIRKYMLLTTGTEWLKTLEAAYLVSKYPTCYETRRVITVFTKVSTSYGIQMFITVSTKFSHFILFCTG